MNFEEKYAFAMKELERSSIWRSNYNPLFVRLMRKLGFKQPPPHYNSFVNNAALIGLMFGVLWGAFMYLLVWKGKHLSPSLMLSGIGLAGLWFGLMMASYYQYAAKRNNLTAWRDIATPLQ